MHSVTGCTIVSVPAVDPANAVLYHLGQLVLSVYEIMCYLRKLMKAVDSLQEKKNLYT